MRIFAKNSRDWSKTWVASRDLNPAPRCTLAYHSTNRLTWSKTGRSVGVLIPPDQPDELGDSIERHLSQLNVTSTYWPGNDEIRNALRPEQLYRRSKSRDWAKSCYLTTVGAPPMHPGSGAWAGCSANAG